MIRRRLENIEGLLTRIDVALVVRDPGNARSSETFEGLRKQIIQFGVGHRTHIAHLLSLSDSLEREASLELIRNRVNDFLAEIGIMRWTDCSNIEAFDVVEGSGAGIECVEPAIVERLDTGHLNIIRPGKARRFEIHDEQPEGQLIEILVTEVEGPAPIKDPGDPQEPRSRANELALRFAIAGAGLIVGWICNVIF